MIIFSTKKKAGKVALAVTQQQLKMIHEHAEQVYPEECCGVLLGIHRDTHREVVEVRACTNVANPPRSRFEIDAAELVRAQREARERGLSIVGFYHSHPEHDAQWSRTDLKDAEWPGCSYLILEVRQRQVKAERSFELTGDGEKKKFAEEEVRQSEKEQGRRKSG